MMAFKLLLYPVSSLEAAIIPLDEIKIRLATGMLGRAVRGLLEKAMSDFDTVGRNERRFQRCAEERRVEQGILKDALDLPSIRRGYLQL